MFSLKDLSLSKKIVSSVFLLILVTFSLTAILFYTIYNYHLKTVVLNKTIPSNRYLVSLLQEALQNGHLDTLGPILQEDYLLQKLVYYNADLTPVFVYGESYNDSDMTEFLSEGLDIGVYRLEGAFNIKSVAYNSDFEVIGYLDQYIDMAETDGMLKEQAEIALLLVLFLLIAALPISNYIQELTVFPVRRLITSMSTVSANQRYDELLTAESNDEIGQLVEQYNMMLRAIQSHIDMLNHTNHELQETQQKLLQSEKMASIGQLAAGVAHELNTPLGFVINNLGILRKYRNKLTGFVDEVTSENNARVSGLMKSYKVPYIVEDIADVIKDTEEGLGHMRMIVSGLNTMIDRNKESTQLASVIEILSFAKKSVEANLDRNVSIELEVEDLPDVRIHPSQISQVVINILKNAVQASKSDATVYLSAKREDSELLIVCADEGRGMSEEQQLKVFDPFYTTKEVGEGVGLGMYITSAIVSNHNGSIKVVSSEGVGTTITIHLPLITD